MHITFSPVRLEADLRLERHGDALVLNGESFDFAALPEGATLPADAIESPWFAGPVTRQGGVLQLALILPHGNPAPEARLFPAPMTVTRDGPVELPPHTAEEAA